MLGFVVYIYRVHWAIEYVSGSHWLHLKGLGFRFMLFRWIMENEGSIAQNT